jgi:tungstate transport system ATP-binding protein
MSRYRYSLADIEVRYADHLALEVDRLTIAEGELHLLMGANGSGKTTLLNTLAFLNKPDCGEMAFAGSPVTWTTKEVERLRRRVTLLHQHPYLFSGTVFSNAAFGPRVRKMRKLEIDSLVSELLEMVGLKGFESRNARQLSGGQASRVALARCLACKPDVLLLDEPLAQTDRESAEILTSLIASLPRQGITVVMSSHDEFLAQELHCNIIQLAKGRIIPPNGSYGVAASHGEDVRHDLL